MGREPIRISGDQTGQFPWQRVAKATWLYFGALLLLAFLWTEIWRLIHQKSLAGWEFASLFLLSAGLTYMLERCFLITGLGRSLRYRLSFLVPVLLPFVGLAFWLLERLLTQNPDYFGKNAIILDMLGFSIVLFGSFIGALAVTFIREGLWENNYPPPEPVQQEVFRRHRVRFDSVSPPPPIKRGFDFCLACLGLLVSAPVWLLSAFLVWFENPGPILFVKNSVGIGGKNFHQFKLRTMILGAEEHTGPVLSQRDDRRVLISGRFLRKTALDELPQLINILLGEMSFVGPRPQRTVLVHQYLQTLPEYADRHQVLPGLAGLAQVAGDYYLTARQKLRFDKLYIRHASLGFDLKLLVLAFMVTFWFRWRKGWNGRLPRKLLRLGSKS